MQYVMCETCTYKIYCINKNLSKDYFFGQKNEVRLLNAFPLLMEVFDEFCSFKYGINMIVLKLVDI
jgi:hypothetical protein